jgi:cytochrome oxidase Cu insertion factor (SCO1/SenC/PrrC family)
MWRRAEIVAALLLGLTLAPVAARGHEAPSLEEEFVTGLFSPSFTPPPAGTYELPPLKRVPAFVLRDDTGHRVSTERLTAGKVTVVSFIYTACPERLGCPLASLAMQSLQSRVREEGLASRVALLSISFDVGRDTPATLAKYARVYGADRSLWRFATAPSEQVLDGVLESYGQDRAPVYDERGRFTGRYRHVLKVFLVDPDGYIRNVYSAGFLVADLVVNDVKTVLMER